MTASARRASPRAAAACPCGSGAPYSRCCRAFHLRTDDPPTAEALMRSRYSAYAKGLDAYLHHSWHPDTRPAAVELDARHRWIGLTVVSTSAGGPDDATGTVEFVAAFEIDRGLGARRGELREVSEFARLGTDERNRWVYVGETAT